MGRTRQPKTWRSRNEETEQFPPWQSRKDPFAKGFSSPPPSPQVVNKSKFRKHNPFRNDNPFQGKPQCRLQPQPLDRPTPPNRNQKYTRLQTSFSITPRQMPSHVFLQKSRRLKQNLIRSLNEALNQIDQWYPDESLNEDAMDWQPEDEIVIPQQNDAVYSYGETGGRRSDMDERIEECETPKTIRRRAVSDVGVGSSRSADCVPVIV